jgi:membrane protein DedA with SNARE-associated domain
MWATILQILSSVAAGSLLWLGIIFLLAILSEASLPPTTLFLQGLLIFAGFQMAHGEYIVALIPLIATAYIGRLCGSTGIYWLSSSLGSRIMNKFGRYIRIKKKASQQVMQRLGTFALPSIIAVRFIPFLTTASSVACGFSRIQYKNFSAAVTLHVLAWEAVFLALGALGSGVSKFLNPQFQPVLLLIWIATMVAITAGVGYFIFRRARGTEPS